MAADLVGRPEDVTELAAIYRDHGFRDYRTLCRMVRLADPSDADSSDSEVAVAAAPDAPAVHAFLCGLLDPLVDQVPESDGILAAVEQRNILLVRCGNEVAGVLVFETSGVTTILRYWYCAPRFRSLGIGARLIKALFRLSRASGRIILWVVDENSDAIAKYRHYGFSREGLVDRIMIKEWSSAHEDCQRGSERDPTRV
jgi:GNAT superfamily N-acetyltransferase